MTSAEQNLFTTLLTVFGSANATIPSHDDVAGKLDALTPILCPALDSSRREYILKKVLEIVPISQPPGTALSDESEYAKTEKHWFTKLKQTGEASKRSAKYRARLTDKKWPPRVIETIDSDTDKIMDLLGNPQAPSFDVRGLIMGDVQSGKTSNFIAICNKAADAGYRVIIITSGIIEKLRQQTQSRLMTEFVDLLPQAPVPVLTTADSDFDAKAGRVSNQTPLQVFRADVPVLFVVKKNAQVLGRVLKWLQTGGSGKLQSPLLLIDDEADNASINTGDPNTDSPTKINALLRQILNRFEKSSYVGITATPFANVFINPDVGDGDITKQDLFPKSFVYRIEPADSYLTSEKLFQDGSPFLKDIMDLESWLPAKHRKEAKIPTDGSKLPQSLRYAIAQFILRNYVCLCGAIGDAAPIHRSMLIHISRYIPVQNRLAFCVENYVQKVIARAVELYGSDSDKAATNEHLQFLHSVWNEEGIGEKYGLDWNDTLANPAFLKGLKLIQTICVNSGKSAGRLDYDAHLTTGGLQVIAIGGNALARGLTLEGLIVSYFRRNTQMADTLMQMSRWLGHRAAYEDLVTVWLEPTAKPYFDHAMTILEELATMFHQMYEQQCPPKQFALKVRRYPGAFLPTARNKMKSTTDVPFPYNLAGYALETPRLPNDADLLNENEKLVKRFLFSISDKAVRDTVNWKHALFFRDISASKVAGFIKGFKAHAMNYGFEIQQVADCIDAMDASELWDVVLLHVDNTSSSNTINVGTDASPIYLHSSERKLSVINENGKGTIQVMRTKLKVSSGAVMQHGLSREEATKILSDYRSRPTPQGKKRSDTAEAPDTEYLAKMTKSLLVIQHIVPSDVPSDENLASLAKKSFFALSLGFRGAREGPVTLNYHMTKTAMAFFTDSLEDERGDQ